MVVLKYIVYILFLFFEKHHPMSKLFSYFYTRKKVVRKKETGESCDLQDFRVHFCKYIYCMRTVYISVTQY